MGLKEAFPGFILGLGTSRRVRVHGAEKSEKGHHSRQRKESGQRDGCTADPSVIREQERNLELREIRLEREARINRCTEAA